MQLDLGPQTATHLSKRKGDRIPVVIRWAEAVMQGDFQAPDLKRPCSGATVRVVLLALRAWMDSDGTSAWPAHETIAKRCALSRSTVLRALRQAEHLGWLIVIHRRGRRKSNIYRASVPQEFSAVLKCSPRRHDLVETYISMGSRNASTSPQVDSDALREAQAYLDSSSTPSGNRLSLAATRILAMRLVS